MAFHFSISTTKRLRKSQDHSVMFELFRKWIPSWVQERIRRITRRYRRFVQSVKPGCAIACLLPLAALGLVSLTQIQTRELPVTSVADKCDFRIRPCNHCLCRQCAETIANFRPGCQGSCPACHKPIARIVGISGPMNAPGHEAVSYSLPVVMLDVADRRERFRSIVTMPGK